jgi:hypothetical protein
MLTWNLFHIVKKVHTQTEKGKVRYPFGQNLKRLQPHFDSALEWIRSDKLDHDWDGDEIPYGDREFVKRFDTYLKEEVVEFEPYYFPEALSEFIDGITGNEEPILALLYKENEPAKKEQEVAPPPPEPS